MAKIPPNVGSQKSGAQIGPQSWAYILAQIRPHIWAPILGPKFGSSLGPKLWAPNLEPTFGDPDLDPNPGPHLAPKLGPELGPHFSGPPRLGLFFWGALQGGYESHARVTWLALPDHGLACLSAWLVLWPCGCCWRGRARQGSKAGHGQARQAK